MERGLFVAVEGIDGAGTTTLVRGLAERLMAGGWPVHVTREPSDGPVGVFVRQALAGRLVAPRVDGSIGPLDPGALALLFAADRLDHLASEVEPAVEAGRVVLTDRYVLSSNAYQGVDLPDEWVRAINERARPADLTILVRVSVDTALARLAGRGGRRELYERRRFLEAVAARYEAAVAVAGGRVAVVSGEGTPAEVLDAAWRHLVACLPAEPRPDEAGA